MLSYMLLSCKHAQYHNSRGQTPSETELAPQMLEKGSQLMGVPKRAPQNPVKDMQIPEGATSR